MIQQRYAINFTNIEGQAVCHYVVQTEDKYESFYNGQSIGVYSSFTDAADAVLFLANLAAWKPTSQQIQRPN